VPESHKQKHSVPQSGIAPSQVERVDREIAMTGWEIGDLGGPNGYAAVLDFG
jgi:hypothetical protein